MFASDVEVFICDIADVIWQIILAFMIESLNISDWFCKLVLMYTVSQKTVQICFCQNFVKFLPMSIIFGRMTAKRLKLCEVHSFSTSANLRHHTTVLNADVPNCYTQWKLLSAINFLTTWLAHNKLKCGLFNRFISSYNIFYSSVQNCQNLCTNCLKIEGSEMSCLRPFGDDAENVKPCVFAASREYVTVQGSKGLKCAVVCYFQGRIFNPTNLLNHVAASIELMMQIWAI